ncbi:MAG: Ig-like domain-containing protein [Chloroflexota bacterium]
MGRWIRIAIVILIVGAALSQALTARGQEGGDEMLSLHFRRDFGYSLGGQMQGKYTIRVEGPDDVTRVEFKLDDQIIGEDDEAPFSLAFNTGDYSEGFHRFSAVGYKADGQQVESEVISRQFVSGSGVTIVVIAIVALVIVFRLASYFLARRRRSPRGAFGFLGGAVCPNCGRAFGIHWWSLRLGVGRLDRCPHCKKWHMVGRASAEALAAAEELHDDAIDHQHTGKGESEEEAFRRRLEESRYDQQ